MDPELDHQLKQAFRTDTETIPPITLRGGNAIDDYDIPPPYDPCCDQPTDTYLEYYTFWGLAHLDAESWRHYLPHLIDFALRNMRADAPGTLTIEALLTSLRPPDRTPPRLGSLTPAQEAAIVAFLDQLAFNPASSYQELAMQALEEWWLPQARYRNYTAPPS